MVKVLSAYNGLLGSAKYVPLSGGKLIKSDCPGVRPCHGCTDFYSSVYTGLSITITGAADCDVTQTSGGNSTRVYSTGLSAWNSTHVVPVKWAALRPCTGTIDTYVSTVGTVTFTTVNTRSGITTTHTCTVTARVKIEPVYSSTFQIFSFLVSLQLVIGAYTCEQIAGGASAASSFSWPCFSAVASDIGFIGGGFNTVVSGCNCYDGSSAPTSPLRTPQDCLMSILSAIKLNYSFF